MLGDVNAVNWNDVFYYQDGELFYKQLSGGRHPDSVGTRNKAGYFMFTYRRQNYYRHQVIWVMHHGPLPDGMMIRHKDNIKGHDVIDNLTIGTAQDNVHDMIKSHIPRSDNSSGYPGVTWCKNRQQWRVYIAIDGKRVHNCYRNDLNDAIELRKQWEKKYYGMEE